MASGSGRLETKKTFARLLCSISSLNKKLQASCKLYLCGNESCQHTALMWVLWNPFTFSRRKTKSEYQCYTNAFFPFDIELCSMTAQVRRHRWSWNLSPSVLITRPWIASSYRNRQSRRLEFAAENKPCFFSTNVFLSTKIFPCAKINFWFFWRIKSIICFVKLLVAQINIPMKFTMKFIVNLDFFCLE